MVKRGAWLSITPEPERELPRLVATLARGSPPPAQDIAREEAKIERLLLRGGRRRWLQYLHGVVELIERSAANSDPEVVHARAIAIDVIANHHNLLLGLPGPAARSTAADRARLERLENHHDNRRGHR